MLIVHRNRDWVLLRVAGAAFVLSALFRFDAVWSWVGVVSGTWIIVDRIASTMERWKPNV